MYSFMIGFEVVRGGVFRCAPGGKFVNKGTGSTSWIGWTVHGSFFEILCRQRAERDRSRSPLALEPIKNKKIVFTIERETSLGRATGDKTVERKRYTTIFFKSQDQLTVIKPDRRRPKKNYRVIQNRTKHPIYACVHDDASLHTLTGFTLLHSPPSLYTQAYNLCVTRPERTLSFFFFFVHLGFDSPADVLRYIKPYTYTRVQTPCNGWPIASGCKNGPTSFLTARSVSPRTFDRTVPSLPLLRLFTALFAYAYKTLGERNFSYPVPVRHWEITSARGHVHYTRTTLSTVVWQLLPHPILGRSR